MAFKDLVKQQRQGGGGLVSSVGSAAADSVREALDIRNALFSSGSFLNTLFPKVKGFKAGKNVGKSKTPSILSSSGSDLSSSKLDQIGENTKISAKNSFVLPAMARDMNVMRQNIVKLVKLQGGTASTKADMFFMKAGEREAAIENQMSASKQSTSPTKVSDEGGAGGMKSLLMKFLGGLLAILAVGIIKFFTDPEFKEKIKEGFNKFIENLGLEDILLGLGLAIGGVALLFGGLLGPLRLLIKAIGLAAAALGGLLRPGTIKTPPTSKTPSTSKTPPTTGTSGSPGTRAPVPAPIPGTPGSGAPTSSAPGTTPQSGKRGRQSGAKPKPSFKRAVPPSAKPSAAPSTKPTSMAGPSKWKRFTAFVARRAPDLYPKIAQRLAAMAGMATLPMLGWFAAAATALGSLSLAWTVYTLWRDFNAEEGTDIGIDPEASPPTSPESVGQSDGLAMLNRVMDSEGITDPATRDRIVKLAQTESSLDPNALGPTIDDPRSMHRGDRAYGLLQIMPKTAPETGFSAEDIKDPENAATAGVRYFMQNMKRFNNNMDAATVAHHAGPGGAEKYLATGSAGTVDMATGLSTNDYLNKVRGSPSVASASSTRTSTSMPSSRQSGSTINAGSVQVADARMGMGSGQSTIINAPQTTMQAPHGGQRSSGNIPSVVDTDFMRHLVAQLVT